MIGQRPSGALIRGFEAPKGGLEVHDDLGTLRAPHPSGRRERFLRFINEPLQYSPPGRRVSLE
jgi:hypothetical protein